jgi:hypothetical protein
MRIPLAWVQLLLSGTSVLVLTFPSITAITVSPTSGLILLPVWLIGLRLLFGYAAITQPNRSGREVLLVWRWSLAFNLVGVVFGSLMSERVMYFSAPLINTLLSAWIVLTPIASSILGVFGLLSANSSLTRPS